MVEIFAVLIFVLGLLGFSAAVSTVTSAVGWGIAALLILPMATLLDRWMNVGGGLEKLGRIVFVIGSLWAAATLFAASIGFFWGIFWAGFLMAVWAGAAYVVVILLKKR